MTQTVFNRYEKKYLMTELIYRRLRRLLEPHMQVDSYGSYTVCSIYYDTPDALLIRRSLAHPVYKEKLRLRSYGIPSLSSPVFLEIKKKCAHIVNKRRIQLPLREAYDYLRKDVRPHPDGQILREIDFFRERYPLSPELFIACDRVALSGREDPEFRVTFDRNIRSRRTDLALEKGDRGTPLLPRGYYLMESKILGAAPVWFSAILAELALYPVSFSKYGTVYRSEQGEWDLDALMRHRIENWRKLAC